VREFALYLGMNPDDDKDLLWIAVDAMTAKLPEHWEELKAENGQSYYYFKRTGQTQWEHPLDEYYRSLYAKLKKDKVARRFPTDSAAADRGDARRSCAPTAVSSGRAMLPGAVAHFAAAVPILDAAAAAATRSTDGRAAPQSDRQPRADGGARGPQVRNARPLTPRGAAPRCGAPGSDTRGGAGAGGECSGSSLRVRCPRRNTRPPPPRTPAAPLAASRASFISPAPAPRMHHALPSQGHAPDGAAAGPAASSRRSSAAGLAAAAEAAEG
jgi:hypothetical protein